MIWFWIAGLTIAGFSFLISGVSGKIKVMVIGLLLVFSGYLFWPEEWKWRESPSTLSSKSPPPSTKVETVDGLTASIEVIKPGEPLKIILGQYQNFEVVVLSGPDKLRVKTPHQVLGDLEFNEKFSTKLGKVKFDRFGNNTEYNFLLEVVGEESVKIFLERWYGENKPLPTGRSRKMDLARE